MLSTFYLVCFGLARDVKNFFVSASISAIAKFAIIPSAIAALSAFSCIFRKTNYMVMVLSSLHLYKESLRATVYFCEYALADFGHCPKLRTMSKISERARACNM